MKPLAILAALLLVGSATPRAASEPVAAAGELRAVQGQPGAPLERSTFAPQPAPGIVRERSAGSYEPMTPYALAPSRERPAELADDGLGVRSGGSASTPATLDASAVTWEGTLAYALPSYGPRYLAIRQPRGTRVRLCGPAACLTRISTDFGPTLEMARQGRIADVSAVDFTVLCGVPLSFGLCVGTLTLAGLPETDASK